MEELVRFLAERLVEHPEEIGVSSRDEDGALVIELRVALGDMGKVIGKQGRIAKAMRAIVKASASLDQQAVLLDIIDSEEV